MTLRYRCNALSTELPSLMDIPDVIELSGKDSTRITIREGVWVIYPFFKFVLESARRVGYSQKSRFLQNDVIDQIRNRAPKSPERFNVQ